MINLTHKIFKEKLFKNFFDLNIQSSKNISYIIQRIKDTITNLTNKKQQKLLILQKLLIGKRKLKIT